MIHVSSHDAVLRLTFSRPEKKNALTSEMYRVLTEHLLRAESDPAVRVVVFDAEGDAFCAGNDLREFAAVASGASQPQEVRAFLYALADATKPYVAAVQGKAVGIGATLLLHCDLVFLADDAQLSTPFVNLGLVPEAASSLLLVERIGHVQAFEMFALGLPIDADKALSLGIANAVVPANQLHARVMEAASVLSSRPIGALQATKKLMRDARKLHRVMDQEIEVFAERLKSAEALAALQAFAKRGDRGS
jgi:enoyl-CoA hydratase/carnithine racemase